MRGGVHDGATDGVSGLPSNLPGPAPVAGQAVLDLNIPGHPVRSKIREIPIAVQDRSFNADGSLFYPANRALYDYATAEPTPIEQASWHRSSPMITRPYGPISA